MGVRRRHNQRQQQRGDQSQQFGNPSLRPEAKPKASWQNTPNSQEASRAASQSDINLFPPFPEIFRAIDSLYSDELKPFGRILRKRVAECAALAAGLELSVEDNLPDVDIKHLRSTCEASEVLCVEPEEGGDWSALITGRAQAFVNVYSPTDMYPPAMWDAAALYFQDLSGPEMYLPGGRYSCAQALQARGLDFIDGRSLGQVCHIVQLAISQKKILGYLNGAVVPYARSQSKVKEQCANLQTACTVQLAGKTPSGSAVVAPCSGAAAAGSNLTMATWDVARKCLREILDNAAASATPPEALGTVPLSNVKRLFRSRFHTELSETMLGHSKLSELLQDERFGDVCTVQLQGHGYIVMQVEQQKLSLADKLPVYGGDTPASEPRRIELQAEHPFPPEFCMQEPLMLDMDAAGVFVESSPSSKMGIKSPKTRWPPIPGDDYVNSLVRRTFIHASPPPPTPPPNARCRSKSLPKDVGSACGAWEPQCVSRGHARHHAQAEGTESTIDSARPLEPSSPSPSAARSQSFRSDQSPGSALDDPVKVLLRDCNLHSTEPVKIGEPNLLAASKDSLESSFFHSEDAEPRRRLLFCPDEPLALEEAGVFLEPAPRTHSPSYSHPASMTVPRWPSLSPSVWSKQGCVGSVALSKVRHTFIHSPVALPTPLRIGSSRRARSLPKNVGSDKDACEATFQALGGALGSRLNQDRGLFNAGDCGPTPSVYADYAGPDMPCSLASSPAFVPPSPALTASPTYCCARQLGCVPESADRFAFTHPNKPSSPTARSGGLSPGGRPNVNSVKLSLADLLH